MALIAATSIIQTHLAAKFRCVSQSLINEPEDFNPFPPPPPPPPPPLSLWALNIYFLYALSYWTSEKERERERQKETERSTRRKWNTTESFEKEISQNPKEASRNNRNPNRKKILWCFNPLLRAFYFPGGSASWPRPPPDARDAPGCSWMLQRVAGGGGEGLQRDWNEIEFSGGHRRGL